MVCVKSARLLLRLDEQPAPPPPLHSFQGAMCVAYTARLNGQTVVLKTPLPDTSHAAVAANDLEVRRLSRSRLSQRRRYSTLQ